MGNENRPTFPATTYTERQVHPINLACAEHESFKVTDITVCRAYTYIIHTLLNSSSLWGSMKCACDENEGSE
jgi:hypothetical protein